MGSRLRGSKSEGAGGRRWGGRPPVAPTRLDMMAEGEGVRCCGEGDSILGRMGIWGSYPGYEGFVSGVNLLESGNEDWAFWGVSGVNSRVLGIRCSFFVKIEETNGVFVGRCGVFGRT